MGPHTDPYGQVWAHIGPKPFLNTATLLGPVGGWRWSQEQMARSHMTMSRLYLGQDFAVSKKFAVRSLGVPPGALGPFLGQCSCPGTGVYVVRVLLLFVDLGCVHLLYISPYDCSTTFII